MKISDNGINFLKQREVKPGEERSGTFKAYQDPAGVWTIGYGHTHGVKPGMVIDRAMAEKYLHGDLREAEGQINKLVKKPLNQNQYDGLVSFQYNTHGLRTKDKNTNRIVDSKVLKALNKGKYEDAWDEMKHWNHITKNGKRIEDKGLTNRRALEDKLIRTPVEQDQQARQQQPQQEQPLPQQQIDQSPTLEQQQQLQQALQQQQQLPQSPPQQTQQMPPPPMQQMPQSPMQQMPGNNLLGNILSRFRPR